MVAISEDGARASKRVSILDRDAELQAAVTDEDLLLARRAMVGQIVGIPAGAIAVERLGADDDAWGAYLVSGVVVRATRLGRVEVPELLGPGEVLIFAGPGESSFLPVTEVLMAVEDAGVVTLGHDAAAALARWPQMLTVLERRSNAQRQRAVTMGAIAHLPKVEVRLLAMLWHLAETWGRVGRDGTVIPFALTHAMLGRFVAARRPTISLALRKLIAADAVRRRSDGSWVLPPGSRTVLDAMLDLDARPADLRYPRYMGPLNSDSLHAVAHTASLRAKALRADSAALNAQAEQLQHRMATRAESAEAPAPVDRRS